MLRKYCRVCGTQYLTKGTLDQERCPVHRTPKPKAAAAPKSK